MNSTGNLIHYFFFFVFISFFFYFTFPFCLLFKALKFSKTAEENHLAYITTYNVRILPEAVVWRCSVKNMFLKI